MKALVSWWKEGSLPKQDIKQTFESTVLSDKGRSRGVEILIEFGMDDPREYRSVVELLYEITEQGAVSWVKLGTGIGEGKGVFGCFVFVLELVFFGGFVLGLGGILGLGLFEGMEESCSVIHP